MRNLKFVFPVLAVLLAAPVLANEVVNVYSYREPQLVKPLFDKFTRETGIRVRVINASSGLIERMRLEDKNSPADLLLTVGVSSLTDAKTAGLTQAVDDSAIVEVVPPHLRDANNHWFGVTKRARIIVASRHRVKAGAITSYAGLASPKWRGRLCTRSAKHNYMVALISAQIAHLGLDGASQWLKGVKRNLARRPQGNDRAQISAVAAGACDLALVNNYYLFVMLSDPKQAPDARQVRVVYPDQQGNGSHVNISGMAMARYAPNRTNALRLMRFLVSSEAQHIYASIVGEYPVRAGVAPGELMRSWGSLKEDDIAMSKIASGREQAISLVNRLGYDL